MNKHKIIIVICVIVFMIVLLMLFLIPSKATVYIKDIIIKEANVSEIDLYSFNADINKISKTTKIKTVCIDCTIKNCSIKKINNAQLRLVDEQQLPCFILGTRLELVDGYNPVVGGLETINERYLLLIDGSNYTDSEIVEALKNVSVCVADKVSPYGIDDIKMISKPALLYAE